MAQAILVQAILAPDILLQRLRLWLRISSTAFKMHSAGLISVVVVCAAVQRCSSWSIGPMSPELWMKANKNWNATMTSYRQTGYSVEEGSCSSDLRQQTPACLQYEKDWCWATGVAELTA